ncbi:mRNA export factor mex67 [Psilocybe cubensis]|uniref:mRNA export factor mex67 n=2 Tax=Psilocybe cubensis TaxID=181762 RepID=A0ACB8H3I8_PSICU|nr:mRNA export factor mex67 [Psilocybe cubensis]KAH9481760.1 mRNA export factor mex67 [Psilocybe cubensis]
MSVSAPPAGSKSIASSALRSAGLIDRDATMRDADNPGGRKGKLRSGRTMRMDITKDRPSSTRMHPVRLSASAGPSDPLTIRGASRPSVSSRMRRNAISGASSSSISQIPLRMKTKVVDAWREFVQKRWNPEMKYLNLDSMNEDEVVKKYNLTPPGSGGSSRDAAVIFKLASQLKPEVETLSLANNNLTGTLLMQLSRYLPKLVNLSLQNNKIRDKKELTMIVSRKEKMLQMRELVLTGNPLRELAYKAGQGAAYRSDIARRFTALAVLDQEPIAQISFDGPQPSTSAMPVEKPNATTFPFDMSPSFVTGVDGALVSKFLVNFFNAFDSQRESLINAYDPAATFSFSANTSIPARARLVGFHSSKDMPNQRKLEWKTWLDSGSRNLNRIGSDPQKTLQNLHVGADQIVQAMRNMPPTAHDILGPSEKFCIDAFPVMHGQSMGLLLTVHGQFTEPGPGGVRSFDRTFMLVPAADGSRAKLNGWDIVILSDQWIIRSYSSHEAWKAGPLLVQAVVTKSQTGASASGFSLMSFPPDQQAVLAQLPEAQRNLVVEISSQTRLNAKFAIDCLQLNGWDLAKAVANFNQVKASLAADAFL